MGGAVAAGTQPLATAATEVGRSGTATAHEIRMGLVDSSKEGTKIAHEARLGLEFASRSAVLVSANTKEGFIGAAREGRIALIGAAHETRLGFVETAHEVRLGTDKVSEDLKFTTIKGIQSLERTAKFTSDNILEGVEFVAERGVEVAHEVRLGTDTVARETGKTLRAPWMYGAIVAFPITFFGGVAVWRLIQGSVDITEATLDTSVKLANDLVEAETKTVKMVTDLVRDRPELVKEIPTIIDSVGNLIPAKKATNAVTGVISAVK